MQQIAKPPITAARHLMRLFYAQKTLAPSPNSQRVAPLQEIKKRGQKIPADAPLSSRRRGITRAIRCRNKCLLSPLPMLVSQDNFSQCAHPSESQPQLTWMEFHRAGITVAAWAKQRGFSPRLVYEVLRGNRKCLRGQSALIAEALHMK